MKLDKWLAWVTVIGSALTIVIILRSGQLWK